MSCTFFTLLGSGVGAGIGALTSIFANCSSKQGAIMGASLGATTAAAIYHLPDKIDALTGNLKKTCAAVSAIAATFFTGTFMGIYVCQKLGVEISLSKGLETSGQTILTVAIYCIACVVVSSSFICIRFLWKECCKKEKERASEAPQSVELAIENPLPEDYRALGN